MDVFILVNILNLGNQQVWRGRFGLLHPRMWRHFGGHEPTACWRTGKLLGLTNQLPAQVNNLLCHQRAGSLNRLALPLPMPMPYPLTKQRSLNSDSLGDSRFSWETPTSAVQWHCDLKIQLNLKYSRYHRMQTVGLWFRYSINYIKIFPPKQWRNWFFLCYQSFIYVPGWL